MRKIIMDDPLPKLIEECINNYMDENFELFTQEDLDRIIEKYNETIKRSK